MSSELRRGLETTVVGLAVFMLLAATASHYGLGYDEPVYMSRAQEASGWLSLVASAPGYAVSDEGIRGSWDARNEQQPGFLKLWGALATPVFATMLPALAALRVGTCLLVAAMCACMYVWIAALWGRIEALAAVLALLTMPRVFAHSHLFALDAPVMATTFITLYLLYLTARDRSWTWAAAAGAVWGIALGCKVNAVFVPIIALPWLALCARDAMLPALVCGALLGPGLFTLTWPWLWHDAVARLADYARFHARHWQIGVTYFGRVYAPAPWHYPAVMTLVTVPLATLGATVAGVWRVVRERTQVGEATDLRERWADVRWRRRATAALLGWALAVNFLMNSLPATPKYNGCRLFLPVFPLIAMLAGIGIGWGVRAAMAWLARTREDGQRLRRPVAFIALALVFALPLRATVETHPHQMSYYNALIGGLDGAERRGMEVTYWGETYLDAALWLNEHAPGGAVVWIEPAGCEATMGVYRTLGLLRQDIRTVAGPDAFEHADFAVFQNKTTEFSDIARGLLAERVATTPVTLDGVPLLYIFDLRSGGR
jgi:hypothetical protein